MSKTLVFLCSGGGGNLKFVYHAIRNNWIHDWSRVVVIADRNCSAIDFAKSHNLLHFVVDFSEEEQSELLQIISSFTPDLIITTVNRILCPAFVNFFKGRLFNLHYSLLPAYAGLIGVKPVSEAINHGMCLIGATVHDVTEVVDDGQPQVQVALPLSRLDTKEIAMDLIFRAGCYAILTAIRLRNICRESIGVGGVITLGDRPALINPFFEYPNELANESFWKILKS